MNMRKINTIIAVIITFYSLFNSVISYAAEIKDADNIIAEGESIYHGFVSDLDLVDSEEEYMMVQNCINEFFMLKKSIMIGECVDESAFETVFLFSNNNEATHLYYYMNKYLYYGKLYEIFQSKYIYYDQKITINSLEISEEIAYACVNETVDYLDEWTPNLAGCRSEIFYITFQKEHDRWYIVDLSTENSQDIALCDTGFNYMSLIPENATQYEREIDTELGNIERVFENYEVIPNAYGDVAIDQAKLLWYINSYTYTNNSLFSNFSSWGGDCQNFASQCIWYAVGGANNSTAINGHYAPMMTGGSNNRKWYSDGNYQYDPACNWIDVDCFANYIAAYTSASGGLYGQIISGCAYAKPGDIIQIDTDGNGAYEHSVVVYSVTGTYGARGVNNITIAEHSPNQMNNTLSIYAGQTFRTIHIVYYHPLSGNIPQ